MLKIRSLQEAYRLAMAIGQDAANRQMRKAGRSAWNEDDWNLAAEKSARIYAGRAKAFGRDDLAAAIESDLCHSKGA